MKKLKLLTKIYINKKITFNVLKEEIHNAIKDLHVTITSLVLDEAGFIQLTLEGEDEVAATNYLISLYGESKQLENLQPRDVVKGYVCSSGKVGFGLFVDIGIKEPYVVDALIPLYALRSQLMDGKKIPVRKIIDLFGLIDNLPLEIVIENINIGLKKIEARISETQLEIFRRWIEEGLDKLMVIGAFREEIEQILEESKHDKDIIEIETLGWMENILTCKFNTTAKGLIPEIGRLLPAIKLEIFSPAIIKKVLKESI